MEIIKSLIEFIKNLLQWWVVVLPWEQGVRVRLGKYQKTLNKGIHLKIPFIDATNVQCTRKRMHLTGMTTITTLDGHAVSIAMLVEYAITDVSVLINSLFNYEAYLRGSAEGLAASYISSHNAAECSYEALRGHIVGSIGDGAPYGLEIIDVNIVQYALVRTYRLIQDQSWGIGFDAHTVTY